MDAFLQNMHNKTVQERLCTEPGEHLPFAVASGEDISQQKSFAGGNEIKRVPVYTIYKKGKNPCTRCGMEFVKIHVMTCKAKNEQCRNCELNGHFMCKRPKNANFRGTG